MAISGRGWLKGILGAAAAALLVVGWQALQDAKVNLATMTDSPVAGGDMERFILEYYRFSKSLVLFGAGSPLIDHDQLVENFDVLWGRCELLLEGRDYSLIRGKTRARAHIESIYAALQEAEDDVLDLEAGDAASAEPLITTFSAFDQGFSNYLFDLSTGRTESLEERRQTSVGVLARVNVLVAIGAGVGGILVILISAEAIRARRAELLVSKREEHALYLAQHDPLTGLLNRSFMTGRLPDLIRSSIEQNQQLALFALDLDGFKKVNDVHGHQAGDQLLVQVADRLRDLVRKDDNIVRLGGDEFVVVFANVDEPDWLEAKAQTIIETISQPYQVEDAVAKISTSIGIALVDDELVDYDSLFKAADKYLYDAKAAGRGTYRFANQMAPLTP